MKKVMMVLLLAMILSPAFAFARNSVTATIAAAPPVAGSWTGAISSTYKNPNGHLNIGVYGATWAGTVYLQRSFDGGTTWQDVTTFISNAQKALVDTESGNTYRIGIKSGGYSSGSVAVRLSN